MTKADVANGGTVNANVSIKIILKMIHQHPHQHLNLKNKFINLKIYKKPKNIIKNKKNYGT